jgi:para-aminobenzoate synthetase component 1
MSKDSNVFKLIKGCFPGGSITGAPKIRSMQIINEVEPNRRNIYCGSIGYISSNQRVDLNIAIRTVIASNNKLHFWGGGGIVYDSDVKSEYKETLDKIKPILDLLGVNN